jgi:hypothetical protein
MSSVIHPSPQDPVIIGRVSMVARNGTSDRAALTAEAASVSRIASSA